MSDTHTDELSEIMDVKEPITYDEQVKRIAAKDFIVENPDSCKEFLKQANYYRLLAYYLPFKKKDGGKFPLWVIIEFFSMGTLSYLFVR